MSCLFDKNIIQKYADNTIDPLEFVFLKEHINYCEECKEELELVMTTEERLEKFFVNDTGVDNLDLMISKLVEDCMYELNKREKLKYMIRNSAKLGSNIIGNSLRFVEHIPGNKKVSKGAKKTASGIGCFMKTLLKKEAVKLIANVRFEI